MSAAFIVSATSPQDYLSGASDMTSPRNNIKGTGGACPAAPVNVMTGVNDVNDKIDYCRRSSRTPVRIEQYKPESRAATALPSRRASVLLLDPLLRAISTILRLHTTRQSSARSTTYRTSSEVINWILVQTILCPQAGMAARQARQFTLAPSHSHQEPQHH